MSFGFLARNDDNILQIDSTYKNYLVTEKGVSAESGATYFNGPLDRSNLIFVRPPIGRWCGTEYTYPGGSPDPTGIRPPGNYFYISSDADQGPALRAIPYAVAVRKDAAGIGPAGRFGLSVNDGGGVQVYDSRLPNLVIAGVILAKRYPRRTYSLTLPPARSGKQYYILLNPLWVTRYSESSGVYQYAARFTSSTTVEVFNDLFWNDSLSAGAFELDPSHEACVLIAEI